MKSPRPQPGTTTHDIAALGRVMGHYRLVRLLGVGGMGQVFLAEHVVLGRLAAVKVLHPELSRQHEALARFFNEARASAQLRHPGLIDVFDFGWDSSGQAYIVMELVEGSSLRDLIERHSIPIPFAIAVIRQVAEAMQLAHAHGIVHRDLKPENLFLVPDPLVPMGCRVKVLDFGIAKLFGRWSQNEVVTRTGNILGTPAYMAPEQCHGAGHVDERADIYSLGCILFEMLCGRPPFVSDGVGAIIASHLMERPPAPSLFNPDVPPEIDALVLSLLTKTAESRVASMAELVALIHGLSTGEPAPQPELLPWATTLAMGSGPAHLPKGPQGMPTPPLGTHTPPAVAAPERRLPTPPVLMAAPLYDTMSVKKPGRGRRLLMGGLGLAAAAGSLLILAGQSFDGPGRDVEAAALPTAALAVAAKPLAAPALDARPAQTAVTTLASAAADASPANAVEVTPLSDTGPAQVVWHIETNPSGARVVRESDGAELGRTPLELRVPSTRGRMGIIVDKPGYRRTRTDLPLDRDASAIVELARRSSASGSASPRVSASNDEAEPAEADPAPAPADRPRRTEPVADGALDPYGD